LKKKNDVPSIIDLVKIAEKMIQNDLELLIGKTVKNQQEQYVAVITAIQIHGDNDKTYIYPHLSADYVVVNGQKVDIEI